MDALIDSGTWQIVILSLAFIAFGFAVVGGILAKKRLTEWALECGFEIMRMFPAHQYPQKGAYAKRRSPAGSYYVVIRDRDGHRRQGWVDVGGVWSAFREKPAIVAWDTERWGVREDECRPGPEAFDGR